MPANAALSRESTTSPPLARPATRNVEIGVPANSAANPRAPSSSGRPASGAAASGHSIIGGELLHDVVGYRVVRVDILDFVRLFQHIDELENLFCGLLIERYLHRRQER